MRTLRSLFMVLLLVSFTLAVPTFDHNSDALAGHVLTTGGQTTWCNGDPPGCGHPYDLRVRSDEERPGASHRTPPARRRAVSPVLEAVIAMVRLVTGF